MQRTSGRKALILSSLNPVQWFVLRRRGRRAALRLVGRCLILLATLGMLLSSSQSAWATSASWLGTTDALWLTNTNWSGSPATVPGAGDTATFNGPAGTGGAIITTGNISLGTLAFDLSAAAAYTIGGATAGTGQITFANGTTNIITRSATVTNNELINANIILGTAIASNSTISNTSTTGTLTIAGDITGGTGGTAAAKTLTIAGAGNTILSGAVTKGGATSLTLQDNSTGTLTISNPNSLFTSIFFNGGGTSSILDIGAGTLKVNNAGGTGIQTQGTTSATINASGGGSIALQVSDGDWGAANGTTLTINAAITGTFGYENYVASDNTGVTVLANDNNSFTGGVKVHTGIVRVGSIGNTGLNSALGTGGTITIGTGTSNLTNFATLRYTGGGELTNKVINIGATTGGSAIDMSGTGVLQFTNTAAIAVGAGIKTFRLTGSTAGVGRLDSILADNTGTNKTNLSKTGTGTWMLAGANTYTGTTAIAGGHLISLNSQGLGIGSAVTVSANAGLSYVAPSNATMSLASLAFSGAATLGGTIGATANSAQIVTTGNATAAAASALTVNVYGLSSVAPATGTFTLLHGNGGANTLNNFTTLNLGKVYNNTNWTITPGSLAATASDITIGVTSATALTTAFWNGGLAGGTNVWALSDGTANSNWVTAAGGGATPLVPGTATDVTISATAPTVAPTSTVLGANMTIKSLTIADTTNGLGLDADGYTLTISPAASSAGITMNASVPSSRIGANLTIGAAQTWTNNSTNPLIIAGTLNGSAAITKAGTGPLTLAGTGGNYSGTLTLSAGTVNINNTAPLGATGALTIGTAGVVLANTRGSALTTTSANPLNINQNFTFNSTAGTGDLNLASGAVTLGASPTITVTNSGSTLTLGGNVAMGTNALTKAGAGALRLNGVVSGTTADGTTSMTINAGELILGGTTNTFQGNINVSGATAVLTMANGGSTGFTTSSPFGATSAGGYKTVTLSGGATLRLLSGTYNNNVPDATKKAAGQLYSIGTGGAYIDVASNAVFIIDDNGQLTGNNTITKIGLGTFRQDDNTGWAGALDIQAGTLQAASGNAFGATSAGTTIRSGAVLDVNDQDVATVEPLTLHGSGLASNPAGALNNMTGGGSFAGPITLGSNAQIGGGGGALTLSNTVNIGAFTLTLGQGAGRTTMTGAISGAGAVVVNGTGLAGDWANSAAHTYQGGTTLNAGSKTVVGVNSTGVGAGVTNGAFGTGTLILNGGALRSGNGSPFTVGNTVTLQADTLFYDTTTTGEKSLTLAGPMTLTGATRTITSTVGNTVPGTMAIISGDIGDGSNGYGLIKAGTGNLSLEGNNTYGNSTTGTTVNAGLLNLTGSLKSNTPLTVAGGAAFSLLSNSANPLANISTLNLGTAAATTTLTFDLGANTAASDSLVTPNAATTAGTVALNLNAISGFGSSSSYTLISAPSGLDGATYTLASVPGGYVPSLNATSSSVVLNLAAAAGGNLYWRGALNGSWNAFSSGTTNWATDASGASNAGFNPGASNIVNFSASGATGPAISTTLDGNFTIGELKFASAPLGVSSVAIANGVFGTNTLTIAPASAANGIALAQGAGAVTISAPVNLGASQTWSVDSSTPGAGTASSLTVSGPISGAAGNNVTFTTTAGTTPIILSAASGANTYSGGSTVSANTIVQGGGTNAFSANSAWTVHGTLNTGAFNQTVGSLVGGSGIVQNGSATNATLTIGSDNLASATFGGIIQNGSTGTLGLTKVGTGTQTISGTSNTYTGATTVNAGTLKIGATNALSTASALTLSGNGTIDLNGFSQSFTAITATANTNTITNSSTSTAASTATTTGTPSGAGIYVDALTTGTTGTIAAKITDGGTRKTQIIINNANGNSALTNGTNTFSGGLVLSHSATGTRLTMGTITAGAYGSGPIIIGQTATDRAGIFFSTATQTLTNPVVFNTNLGTDRYGIRSDVAGAVISGVVTANVDAVFMSNATTGALALTNQITGAGGLVLDLSQTSTGNSVLTLTLNNATANPNNYQGDTIVGRTNVVPAQNYTANLTLARADQIPNGVGAGNVILNNNSGSRTGNLNLGGFNETINGLLGNGTVDGTSGTPVLMLGDNNATASFTGVIKNTAGTLSIVKTGSGTQTLGGANTFAGSITANAGILAMTGTNTFTGAVNANSGGTVAFANPAVTGGSLGNSTVVNLNGGAISYTAGTTNALNRSVSIGANAGTIDVASALGILTVGSVTSTGGNLVKSGPGTLQLTSATTLNSGNAGVVVNGGTLQGSFGTGGIGSINVGGLGNLSFQNTLAEVLTLGGTGSLTLASGAQLGFDLGATGSNDSIVYNTASGTGSVTLNLAGITGFGAGTYQLLHSTTNTGQLSGFNFQLGSAPNGFNYTINNDGTSLSLTTIAYSPIYWTGGTDASWATAGNFASDSAGTTLAGHTPLATETVIFNATNAVGPSVATNLDGSVTVDSVQFNGAGTPVATSVTIAQGSGGTLTLKPASASGGLALLTGAGNAEVAAPVTLDSALSATQTWSVADLTSTLVMSGNVVFGANVNKTGAGAVTLSGANSGAGIVNLNGGTLNLNSAGALGTGTLKIAAGTTINNTSGGAVTLSAVTPVNINGDFAFTGSNALTFGTGPVTVSANPTITALASTLTFGGIVSGSGLTKAGAGTMVLSGNNTYSGTTNVNGGALTLAGTNTTTGQFVLGGGTLNVNHAGALGAASNNLVINSGGLGNTSVGPIVDAATGRAIAVNGSFSYSGPNNLDLSAGVTTLNTSPTITTTAGNLTIGNIPFTALFGLTKAGAGSLTLAGTNDYRGNTVVNGGTLNITGTLNGLAASTALRYGDTVGNTVVNLSGGFNGFITTGANVAGSVAVFNQTAGTVTIVPPNGQDQQYIANNGGYGMLNITGGTFNVARFDGTGATNNNASTAVIYVGGTGTLNQNVGDWFLPIRNSGMMSMTIAPGGSFVRSSAVTAQFSITGLATSTGNNSYGILNVAGGTADTGTRGINFSQGSFASGTFTSNGFVNLAGGTLSLGVNTGVGAAAGTTNGYFNFAGGTLNATAAMTSVIPASTANYIFTSTIFGPITNNNNANAAFNAQVGSTSNFTGGLTVDTNTFAVTLSNALLGADGKFGVTQANLTIPSTGNSGYVGAPMVQFAAPAAGGVPASGYALISGGQVTGIVITNPGTYATGETPLITLTGGGGSIAPFNTSAITTAHVSAGLTKIGTSTLTLTGANTYSGGTAIDEGTLQLGNAGTTGSLSPSSAISIANNAVLAFNRTNAAVQGTDFSSASITGAGSVLVTGATGSVTLNVANGYTGGTTVGGTTAYLIAAHNNALGSGTLNLKANPGGAGTTFQLSGGITLGNAIAMDANTGREAISSINGNNVLNSNITINAATTSNNALVISNDGTTGSIFTVNGNITAPSTFAGGISLRALAANTSDAGTLNGTINTPNSNLGSDVGGIWTIASTGNTWLQTQLIAAVPLTGLKLGATNALATSADVLWGSAATGTLYLNGFNQTVAGIASTVATTPTITNGTATNSTLTISGIGTSPKNFTGVIQDGSTGKVNFIMDSAAKTQILSGPNTYTGTTTITAGTLQLGNGAGTGTLNPLSTITNDGTFAINRTGTVTQGVDFSTAAITGTGNFVNTAGTTIFNADNSYAGTTTVSAGALQLGAGGTTGTFGQAAVTNNGTLIFNRTNTYTLAAGNLITGTGGIRLDSGTLATVVDNQINVGGALTIGSAINSTVPAHLDLTGGGTVGGLVVQTNSLTPNTITVPSGKMLTVNGDVSFNSTVDAGNTLLTVKGAGSAVGGSMVVNGAIMRIGNNTGGANTSSEAILDVSALSSFSATLSGNLVIQASGDNSASDPSTFILSNTANSITAAGLLIGNSSTGAVNTLMLGTGSNTIRTNTINLGNGDRDTGVIDFAGTDGTLNLRNVAGTGRVNNVNLGVQTTQGTGYTTANLIDLTGNNADVAIDVLATSLGAKSATNTNDLKFNSGTLDIKTINMAAVKGTGSSTNTISIGGGTVRLGGSAAFSDTGTGTVTLATAGTGKLDITGGSVTSTVDFAKGTGAGTATVALNGATAVLDMSGKSIGSSTNLVALDAQAGTLKNLAQLNGGGTLTKTTTGTLKLEGVMGFTGATAVNAGTLIVDATHSGGAAYTVANNATLGGGGTIGSAVTVADGGNIGAGGGINPVVDKLTLLNLTLGGANSVADFDLNGTAVAGTDFDQILLTGVANAALAGNLRVDINYAAQQNDQFILMKFTNPFGANPGAAFAGAFSSINGAAVVDQGGGIYTATDSNNIGYKLTVNYADGGTNNAVLLDLTAVPEPGTLSLIGLAALALLKRRNRNAA